MKTFSFFVFLLIIVECFGNFDYCTLRKDHAFCGQDCMSPKNENRNFAVTDQHIQDMTNSLNTMRTQLMKGELAFKFKPKGVEKFGECLDTNGKQYACPFHQPYSMTEIVRSI